VFAFQQDKESFFEKHRTQKKRFSFSRSLRVFPSLTWSLGSVLSSSLSITKNVWSGGPLTPGSAITRPTENICGNSTCLKTPQYYSKEGRLKPFFANNVDIPFARARRLKPCSRKATVRSGKQTRVYVAVPVPIFKKRSL